MWVTCSSSVMFPKPDSLQTPKLRPEICRPLTLSSLCGKVGGTGNFESAFDALKHHGQA